MLLRPHSSLILRSSYMDMLELLTVSFLSLILSPIIFIRFYFLFRVVSLIYVPFNQFSSLTNVCFIEIKNSVDEFIVFFSLGSFQIYYVAFYGFRFLAKFFKVGFYFLKQSKYRYFIIFSQFCYLESDCLQWFLLMVFCLFICLCTGHGIWNIIYRNN